MRRRFGRSSRATQDLGWSAMDYLLHGEFCPPDALLVPLEEVRQQAAAEAALVLIAGTRGLLRSLCWCTTGDEAGAAVNALLRAGDTIRVDRRLRPPGEKEQGSGYPKSAHRLVGLLVKRAKSSDDHQEAASVLGSPKEWAAVKVPRALHGSRLAVAILVRRPRADAITEDDGVALIESDALAIELAVMANATANARVHYDTITTTRVDEILDPRAFASGAIDLQAAARLLVELAAEVSISDAAAYYVADSVNDTLRLEAAYAPGDDGRFPRELPTNGTSVVAASVQRRRPVVHGWEGSDPRLTFTFASREAGKYVEMATPVPGPLASTSTPSDGVLTVVRPGDGGRHPNPFGAYDHALLRNVALRLALVRATMNMESAAVMFAELTTGSLSRARRAAPIPAPSRGGTSPDQTTFKDDRKPSAPVAYVPDDLKAAVPLIAPALDRIAQVTASHSATFRAALPYRTEGFHGLALIRLAASPRDRMTDEGVVQHESDGGVNWDAATTGNAQYLPKVEGHMTYISRGRGTRSEISVPVEVEGRVVGVVNLESPVEHNYDGRLSTAVTFAEHVGLALADVRLAQSFSVQQRATEIVNRGHDVAAETIALVKLASELPSPQASELAAAAERIDQGARGVRVLTPEQEAGQGGTMPQLIEIAKRRANWSVVDHDDGPGERWPTYDGREAELIVECLRHVFVNVKTHAAISGARPRLHLGNVMWGGRRHDVIQIFNTAGTILDPTRAANLYRVPTEREAEPDPAAAATPIGLIPQFGAYLSGLHARLLGGDVYLWLEGSRQVTVTVMIPRPKEAAGV